ncbi:hypothetical protein KHP62_02715 [Rhodobacteraceae bacterium NNCM2]|nr:hypothetical protein [Coraliihabitans acroporae]
MPSAIPAAELVSYMREQLELDVTPVVGLEWYFCPERKTWWWHKDDCANLINCVYWFEVDGQAVYIGKTDWFNARMRGWTDTFKAAANGEGVGKSTPVILDAAAKGGNLKSMAVELPNITIGKTSAPMHGLVEGLLINHAQLAANILRPPEGR